MKAWTLSRYGNPSTLELRDWSDPIPAAGEVRIRVRAASINPIDYKLMRGDLKRIQPVRFPWIPGFDLAGEVEAVGDGATRFKVGDAVFARSAKGVHGAFAESVCLPESWVAAKPASLDFGEAASLPLVGLTTIQGLTQRAALKAGDTILIHAGSGGVGSFAIQYARALGLNVTATCSSRNEALVRELGAQQVICYDREDYRQLDQRFDAVFDLLGGEHTLAAFDLLKPGGVVVSIAGPPDRAFADSIGAGWLLRLGIFFNARRVWQRAERGGFRYFRFLTSPSGEQLTTIAGMVERGELRPLIDSRFPFEQLREAIAHSMQGRARGKIVVEGLV